MVIIRLFYLTGLLAMIALTGSTYAQEPQTAEPRLRIQVDVTASIPDGEKWTEIRSKNFLLAGSASEGDIRRIASDLELMRETFSQFFPRAGSVSSVPTTVIVFRNGSSFRSFVPIEDGRPLEVRGYFREGRDKNYIVLNEGDAIPREVLRDYVRLLIPESMGPVPLWFQEGLADYFSALKVNRYMFGDKRWTRLGTGIDEYDRLLDKKAKLHPVLTLLQVHEESPELKDQASRDLFRAESWALVHYLMSRPGGLSSMHRVLNAAGDGQPLENSFRQGLGRTSKLFEDDFRQYVRISQREHQWAGTIQLLNSNSRQVEKGECGAILFATMRVPYFKECFWGQDPPPPGVYLIPYSYDKTLADVGALPARILTESEAWAHRGDLMLHIDRILEADAYLQKAVEKPPQFSSALASRGLLLTRQKKYGEALAALKLAVQLAPKNYLAHYYTAVLIRFRGVQIDSSPSYDDLEDIHDSLRKAVELAPEFVEASEVLADINLLRRTGLDESEKVLFAALKRFPGRSSTWIALGRVMMMKGDQGTARWLLTRVLATGASDAGSRKAATALLQGLAPGAGPTATQLFTAAAVGTQEGAIRIAGVASPASQRSPDQVSGEKIRGILTNIECKNGLTFILTAGGRTVKLHTNTPFGLIVATRDSENRTTPSGPVLCGPIPDPGVDVTITYRPSRSGDFIGQPLAVEIREENREP